MNPTPLPQPDADHEPAAPALWIAVAAGAMAGGMSWGIRGQYGHETGAMIAGLLVSLVFVLLFCRTASASTAARIVAFATIAMGFGGSMTYGQTIGLTQDQSLVGNWNAFRWGMLGLAIKGGLWIGFAGAFLGMGLGGARYRSRDMLLVMCVAIGAYLLGHRLLNEPFDPTHRVLPKIYFSGDWRWTPRPDLKPRPECWGGMMAALLAVVSLVTFRMRDRLAWRLACWGVLGGAVGFPLGQCIQAWHAWNPEFFRAGFLATIAPRINWWNMMETTFGATMGACLGLGLWIHRKRIQPAESEAPRTVAPWLEGTALVIYLAILILVEFASVPVIDQFFDLGLGLGFLPMVLAASSRIWALLVVLPITLLPIAGKTLQQLAYDERRIHPVSGILVYVAVPMAVALLMVWVSAVRDRAGESAERFARRNLLFAVWLYFSLNYAFFHFPWPWQAWTARTPNAMIFLGCALGLTLVALAPLAKGRLTERAA
jgi:hypothetical protein